MATLRPSGDDVGSTWADDGGAATGRPRRETETNRPPGEDSDAVVTPTAGDVRHLLRTFVVAAGTGLSRLTGFGRVAALAYALGRRRSPTPTTSRTRCRTSCTSCCSAASSRRPSCRSSSSHLDHNDEEATDAVVSVAVVVLLALTVVAVLAAPLIVHLYTLRVTALDQGAVRSEATTLARFFLPQIVFYGITSLGIALLNSRRRFAAAAFAPVLNNLIVIAALIALPHVVNGDINLDTALGNHSITLLLGLSTTGGIIAMTAVVWIAVGHAGIHIRPRLLWRHPAVSEVARLSGWTVGYVIANQVALLVVSILALRGEGDALRVPSRLRLLPAPPRPARGHAHHDVRARARGSRLRGAIRRATRTGSRSAYA